MSIIKNLENSNIIWRGAQPALNPTCVTSTGYPELDGILQGGLATTGVTELISDTGIGELRLLHAFLQSNTTRLQAFITPPAHINAQAMAQLNLSLAHIIIIQPDTQKDALWAMEQCLKSGACHCVLAWLKAPLEVHQVKRLQLASEQGNSKPFIFRHKRMESISLPVDLSVSLQPQARGVTAKINKRKRGWPSEYFNIDMRSLWPQLTVSSQHSDNVIPFKLHKTG